VGRIVVVARRARSRSIRRKDGGAIALPAGRGNAILHGGCARPGRQSRPPPPPPAPQARSASAQGQPAGRQSATRAILRMPSRAAAPATPRQGQGRATAPARTTARAPPRRRQSGVQGFFQG
jgi:hypothetical protein